ncbi:MAG: hypothetical protein NVSMB29_12130 [Candidatus Dormibacteria bacterium]
MQAGVTVGGHGYVLFAGIFASPSGELKVDDKTTYAGVAGEDAAATYGAHGTVTFTAPPAVVFDLDLKNNSTDEKAHLSGALSC